MSDWKAELQSILQNPTHKPGKEEYTPIFHMAEVRSFYDSVVRPAFVMLQAEMQRHGREVAVEVGEASASLEVKKDGQAEMWYGVKVKTCQMGGCALPLYEERDSRTGRRKIIMGSFKAGDHEASFRALKQEEIIQDFLSRYTSEMARHG